MKKQLIDLLKEQDAKFESKSFNTEQISQLQEKLKNVIGSDWIQWPAFKKNFFIEYFAIAIVKLTKNKKFPKMAEQLEIDLWKIGRWIPYFYYVDLANEALEKDERYHNQDGSIDINKKNKLFDPFVNYGGCQDVSWDYPDSLFPRKLTFIEDRAKKLFLTGQEGATLEYFYFLFSLEKDNQFLEYYESINGLFNEWKIILERRWLSETKRKGDNLIKTNKQIEFLKKEFQVWQKQAESNSKNFIGDAYKKYTDKFGSAELSQTTNYEDGLAEFLVKNKEAYYHFAKKDMPDSAVDYVNYFLFGEDEKIQDQVNRLDEEDRLKWIDKLGKTGCNLVDECESSWVNIEDISWQIIEENLEFKRINMKYKDYDFSIPEDQMDYKTKKAWDEYLELAIKLTYPKTDPQKTEKLAYYHWVQTNPNSDVLDFDLIKSWAKNSSEVLEQILRQNKKIYTNMPQTSYDVFSIYEPKSNFNLINNLINKNWEKYQDIHNEDFVKTRGQGFSNFVSDIKSGKIQDPEVELLGFSPFKN
ncbi:hypothetical protein [Mesomycoplasma ovipneumoniae]|uniref:hypothetical protein n=1 Tax=Mesomycoplasma ovipneumoniae TaxID=29562 RepID=UPI002963CC6F|nr:hypothetical protein [Mesomycoplasma ovipneumoniae]MDW2923528.1 hypothetical protein [Mesomycoplasma ovipneumoniae]